MKQGFVLITGLPADLRVEAYVAKLIASSGAYISYEGESYGYHFKCDDLGRELLAGVAAAGDVSFSG
jgi:hypothetical protein